MTATHLSTGNGPLDRILAGGLPGGSMTIVAGLPGTGKTVLAQQLLHTNASEGVQALYLTTVSEPMQRIVYYLQGFSFFKPELVPSAIRYVDIGQHVREEGLDTLAAFLEQLLLELQPSIVVIDSFKALRDMVEDPRALRLVVFDLARIISMLGVTTVLVGEYSAADAGTLPEFAVADVVIEMINRPRGVRDERALRVHKLRGAPYASGEHSLRISERGIEVFPRLTGTDARPDAPFDQRLTSGTRGLDRLLGGGLWRGSTTLVAGPTGVGKTMLALGYLLAGARVDEPGVLISFEESPNTLRRYAASLGADLHALEQEGLIHVIYVSPLELDLVELFARVKEAIEAGSIRRVVIDALNDMLDAAVDRDRFRATVWSLAQYLSLNGVTGLLLMETPLNEVEMGVSAQMDLSYMAHNVILMRYPARIESGHQRTIQVLKTRGSPHEPGTHPLWIRGDGIAVGEDGADRP